MKEIKVCNLCELCKSKSADILPQGSESSEIMAIFLSPSEADEKNGKIYSGNFGKKILELFDECKLSSHEIYTTFLIKCPAPNDINMRTIVNCSPYIFDEIKLVKPKIVLLFGAIVSKIVLRNEQMPDISLIHGSMFMDGDVKFMPTFDMHFIALNPSKIELFKADLKKAEKNL